MKKAFRYLFTFCLILLLTAGAVSCKAPSSEPEGGTQKALVDPAHEHQAGEWMTLKEATCTEAGVRCRACTVCDEMMETKVIPALGHDLTHHEKREPTCDLMGWGAYDTCRRCDYTSGVEAFPHLGHAYTHYEGKEATCTESGWHAYDVCSRCGDSTYREIPVYGHWFCTEFGKEPTCTEGGWKDYKQCSRCGRKESYEELPVLGHRYKDYSCIRCWKSQSVLQTWDISGTEYDQVTARLYDETGGYLLRISGTGNMKNWYTDYEIPWISYSESIVNVRIDSGVTSIGNFAFYNCVNLKQVTIGPSVQYVGDMAFAQCASLTSVHFPASVNRIDAWGSLFTGCYSLNSITVENGNYTYYSLGNCLIRGSDNTVIAGCNSSVIPDGVTAIGFSSFAHCRSLKNITIPDSVTSIGSWAFDGCAQLIEIENGVQYIGKWVIRGDAAATSVSIREGTVGLADGAFGGCEMLENIKLPNSLMYIGESAFYGCIKLKKIDLPENTEKISERVFSWCTSLECITIPESVTSIGDWAFEKCNSLTDVYYGGSQADWEAVSVDDETNEPLLKANIHYQSA